MIELYLLRRTIDHDVYKLAVSIKFQFFRMFFFTQLILIANAGIIGN
jgi:hypothetical protein